MADSSDDEFGVYDAAEGSRYPVHDCVEFEDADSLRVSSGVRLWRPGGGGPSPPPLEVQVETQKALFLMRNRLFSISTRHFPHDFSQTPTLRSLSNFHFLPLPTFTSYITINWLERLL